MIYKLKGTLTSAIFVVLILIIASFFVLSPLISMIILGAIFAYAIRPISGRMNPYLKFESVSIFLAMMLVITPLILIIAFSISTIIDSAPVIMGAASNVDAGSLNQTINQTSTQIASYIPGAFQPSANSIINGFKSLINAGLNVVLGYAGDIVQSIPMVALQLFIFIASTFYLAKDGDKILEYLRYALPQERRNFFRKLSEEVERVLKSIFYGHFLTALIIGIMAALGFYILGYPYALFLGILTGFLQLIPIIGPWPTYTALAIYDFATGNIPRGIIVLLFGFFLSGSDIYIRPKLSGKYADIHPLIFLLGFLGGPLVFGIVGFILGPLILGVTYAALLAYKNNDSNES
ncbi:MAG: AI-2E family transporter [Methanobacteriaceae archaeon]|nr:AI-2E family transporter [Methanobacteriaceae archaeon]MDO9627925.1 AI-2E family transporter [Methanobacteriaceae archaeon]